MIRIVYDYLLKQKKYSMLKFLTKTQLQQIANNPSIDTKEKVKIFLMNNYLPSSFRLDEQQVAEALDALIELTVNKNEKYISRFFHLFIKGKNKYRQELFKALVLLIVFTQKEENCTNAKEKEKHATYQKLAHKNYGKIITALYAGSFVSTLTVSQYIVEMFLRCLETSYKQDFWFYIRRNYSGILQVPEVRAAILTKETLNSNFFSFKKELFYNLPPDKLSLLGYFKGVEEDVYKQLKNNFRDLTDKQIKMIVPIFGSIEKRSHLVHYLDLILEDPTRIEKINIFSQNAFGDKIHLTLTFLFKYQSRQLTEEILGLSRESLASLQDKLRLLADIGKVKGIHTLEDIINATYDELFQREYEVKSNVEQREMTTLFSNKPLGYFKYPLEVLLIHSDGTIEELPVNDRHFMAIKERFPEILPLSIDIFALSCELNTIYNSVVWNVENSGVTMFYPPEITLEQREKALELLQGLRGYDTDNEILIAGGITLKEEKRQMYCFNDGMTINVDQAIIEINRIPINEERGRKRAKTKS